METDKAYITSKGFISIKGEDSIDFIQNIISNDIKKVTDNNTIFASLLTAQGKFLFEFIILKTKNIFDNKSANQIDLFSEDETSQNNIINDIEDWKFEERLSKEFEAVGFFISDHPLNQFIEIFDDYEQKGSVF